MKETKKLHPALAALIVIVLVGIVASVAIVIKNSNDNSNSAPHDAIHDHSHGATDPVDAPASTDTSSYRNGTYEAIGSYVSPGGKESVDVTITIKDGKIIETSMTAKASDPEAKQHQQLFADHYKELIVGRKLNDVGSLSRVAGSSLTSNGFNDALDQIKNDARV